MPRARLSRNTFGGVQIMGYVKRIALIKGVRGGFSADGGQLSGLVKCEAYAGFLKAEISLINFAPLSEGRYVFGISDGERVITFDDVVFEGEAEFDPQNGFACLICFRLNGSLTPIASAACGCGEAYIEKIKTELAFQENSTSEERGQDSERRGVDLRDGGQSAFDDEAIAEENYYELEADEGGGAVREDKAQEEKERSGVENEENTRAVEEPCGQATPVAGIGAQGGEQNGDNRDYVENSGNSGGYGGENSGNGGASRKKTKEDCREGSSTIFDETSRDANTEREERTRAEREERPEEPRLARGGYYERMKGEIEKIFSSYPAIEGLEKLIEQSRWVKISYGEGKYYAFGVIFSDGIAEYICYGVPSSDPDRPPQSLSGACSFIPVGEGGYWVMYQDASTGVSVKISAE